MPLAFTINKLRTRSLFFSSFLTLIQVSARDDTASTVASLYKFVFSWVNAVNNALMLFVFNKSINLTSIARTSLALPIVIKLLIGSIITVRGLNSSSNLCNASRCISSPCNEGREAWMYKRFDVTWDLRDMPIDRIFRINWSGDSSKEKYSTRSLRLQLLNAKYAARIVFDVPAVPVSSVLLPR